MANTQNLNLAVPQMSDTILQDIPNIATAIETFDAEFGLSGPTTSRPTANLYVGRKYYDTTIGSPVYWSGTEWVIGKQITTTITATPTSRDHSNITYKNYTISGASTMTQPTTGYVYVKETIPNYTILDSNSGWNQSMNSNVGRTGIVANRIELNHDGQGDMVAYNGSGWVGSTLTGATHFLASPAVVLVNGDMDAGANGVYLNTVEFHHNDNGYDCAAIGMVLNFNRTNNTGALSAHWGGIRQQSIGTKPVDWAYVLQGEFNVGFDTTPANLGTNKAAIAIKGADRIYLDASSTPDPQGIQWCADTPGSTWIEYNTSENSVNVVVGGNATLQVQSAWAGVATPFQANYFEVGGKQVVGAQQPTIANPGTDGTSLQTAVEAIISTMKTHGLIAAS